MSDLTPKGTLMTIDGVEREFLFTFSVIDALQSEFNEPIDTIMSEYLADTAEGQMVDLMKKTTKILEVFAGIEKGHFDNFVTSQNVYPIAYALVKEYGYDLPEMDEDDEDNDPNMASGQQ